MQLQLHVSRVNVLNMMVFLSAACAPLSCPTVHVHSDSWQDCMHQAYLLNAFLHNSSSSSVSFTAMLAAAASTLHELRLALQ